MTIELTQAQLATGCYGSWAEVIAEALELLQDHTQLERIKLERLHAEIQKGLSSGESTPICRRLKRKRGDDITNDALSALVPSGNPETLFATPFGPIDRPHENAYPRSMTLELRPELEQLIERKLATGRYADRGAVIEEALELMRQQDDAVDDLREALSAAHRRNADLDPDAAIELVEEAVREHRQSPRH